MRLATWLSARWKLLRRIEHDERTILTLRRELATERHRLLAAQVTIQQRERTIVALRARCDQLEALHRDRKAGQ